MQSRMIDSHDSARTRHRISESDFERQRATARFILRTASLAFDLYKVASLVDAGYDLTDDVKSAMAMMEKEIRDCYAESFGEEFSTLTAAIISANPQPEKVQDTGDGKKC